MRVHFGTVTENCSSQDIDDLKSGKTVWQPKSVALYPIDTKALVPKCLAKGDNGEDGIIYEQGENIWLWVSVGLVGLLLLILIVAALKGGGGQAGTIIYR